EEFIAMPARGQWTGLGFAVAYDAGDDQVWVVERGAIGMAEGVAEFPTFMDASGGFGSNVARDAAGEAELLEQLLHPLHILADVWVHLAVGPFQVGMGNQGRAAMSWADDVDHVQVIALDDAVEVDAEHVQARRRSPVAEQARLNVLALQRLLEKR